MSTTVAASPELKSIFYRSGLWAEKQVRNHFKNLRLLAHRHKTPYAELDLLFAKSKSELLIVEVKSLANFAFINYRISKKQKERLFRAREYISQRYNCHVEINWAFVRLDGEIVVIEDVSR